MNILIQDQNGNFFSGGEYDKLYLAYQREERFVKIRGVGVEIIGATNEDDRTIIKTFVHWC